MSTEGKRETTKRVLRWTRKDKEQRERKREGERKSEEREGEKEMQRLPYNGAPRAHKLRHNVISSSLFNERWQRAAHTFYPGVLVIPAPVVLTSSPFLSISLSLFLFHDALFGAPPSSSPRTCCEPCVALSSRGFKRNPPTYRAEPSRAARPYSNSPFHGSRYHFLGANALPALPIIISLLRARARYASFVRLLYLHLCITITRSFAERYIHTVVPRISVSADYHVDARFNA